MQKKSTKHDFHLIPEKTVVCFVLPTQKCSGASFTRKPCFRLLFFFVTVFMRLPTSKHFFYNQPKKCLAQIITFSRPWMMSGFQGAVEARLCDIDMGDYQRLVEWSQELDGASLIHGLLVIWSSARQGVEMRERERERGCVHVK